MTGQVRKPFHLVTVDGVELQLDHGPQITRGLDMLISECTLRVPYNAGTIIKEDSQIQVYGGLSASLARTRFVGFAEYFDDRIWPGELQVNCKGALYLTELSRGASPGGTDLAGATRQDVIIVVLLRSNVPVNLYGLLSDDGTIIGSTAAVDDTRFRWMPGESGLSVLQRYDAASVQEDGSAYRVAEDSGGRIYSRKYTVIPPSTAAYSFYETADDMLDSSHVVSEEKQGASRAEVRGFGDIAFEVDLATPGLTDSFESGLIESTTIVEGVGISAERIALGRLASGKFRFLTVQIDTHRDDPIGPGDVIYVESAHMRVNQTCYVKNVVDVWDENHVFTKRITAVSELGLGTFNRTSAGQPFSTPIIVPTQPDTGPGGTLPPGSPLLPTAAINVMAVDKERVIRSGVATSIYVVGCEDVSTSPASTIASRAWTATGAGAYPTSGTEKYFTVKFDGLVGTVTLTVTDAQGNDSVPVELDISDFSAAQVKSRDLFSILQDGGPLGILEAFDGHDGTWRTYATGETATTLAVANGPCWAVNDIVYRSDDYLRTTPDTATPDSGNNVVRLWIEPDVNINTVAAALADGQIALSTDAGATWTLKAGPDANPAAWIILSRYAAGEIDLFSSTGFWQSPNSGTTWTLIQAGDFTFADLNPFRNWGAAQITGTGKWVQAEGLTAITGTGADDIRAVTSHIRMDRGYALAADGSTWYLATDGATAATAGADIPGAWSGTVQDDVYRDGGLVDLAYFPFGAGGIGKTTDGFKAADGYEQLRKRSIDGANAAGDWPMLGVGLLSTVTPVVPGGDRRLYMAGAGTGKLYKSADSGATWTDITPPGVTFVDAFDALSGASGADVLLVCASGASRTIVSTDGGATWGSPVSIGSSTSLATVVTASQMYQGGEVSTNGGATWTAISPAFNGGWAAYGGAKIWGTTTPLVGEGRTRANLDGSGAISIDISNTGAWGNLYGLTVVSDTVMLCHGNSTSSSEYGQLRKINNTTVTQIPTGSSLDADCYYQAAYALADLSIMLAMLSDTGGNGHDIGELWRSTDGGATWTMVESDAQLRPIMDTPHGHLRVDPNDSTFWVCVGGDAGAGLVDSKMFVSTDSGVTWTGAVAVIGEQYLDGIRVCSG